MSLLVLEADRVRLHHEVPEERVSSITRPRPRLLVDRQVEVPPPHRSSSQYVTQSASTSFPSSTSSSPVKGSSPPRVSASATKSSKRSASALVRSGTAFKDTTNDEWTPEGAVRVFMQTTRRCGHMLRLTVSARRRRRAGAAAAADEFLFETEGESSNEKAHFGVDRSAGPRSCGAVT